MCEKGYNVSYSDDTHFGATAYGSDGNVKQIQAELMRNGPVEADFTVTLTLFYINQVSSCCCFIILIKLN